uniref:DNA-(apurinic or apyrimidinic site) lyase n=1 Tax=viral metagenome TaxID=1070528 RepID=A0A6C0KY23_9ZZZZ
MPEVIEILKYADFLRTKLKHNNITEVNILNGRYKKHGDFKNLDELKKALPQKVKHIDTKGKFLYIEFENGMYLFSSLGLSGGWLWQSNDDKIQFGHTLKYIDKEQLDNYHKEAVNHRNVEFKTKDGSLFFYDTLSFGTLKITTEEELEKKLKTIGPDISQESTTFAIFKERMEKVAGDKPIGNVLLNQRVISGLGNYLRADVLWLSKISPFRKMKDLTASDLKHLWQNSRLLIWSKYNYKKGQQLGIIEAGHPQLPEDYKREFYVYFQENDPKGHPVKKEELHDGANKRFIHWVPDVQK